jgi:hypothetical protein
MADQQWLGERFAQHRTRLRAVAYSRRCLLIDGVPCSA